MCVTCQRKEQNALVDDVDRVPADFYALHIGAFHLDLKCRGARLVPDHGRLETKLFSAPKFQRLCEGRTA